MGVRTVTRDGLTFNVLDEVCPFHDDKWNFWPNPFDGGKIYKFLDKYNYECEFLTERNLYVYYSG